MNSNDHLIVASLADIEETPWIKRKGVNLAPQTIKESLELIESYSPYFKRDINSLNIGEIRRSELNKIFKDGKKVLILGGDHAISFYVISELKNLNKDFLFIYFDAHLDLREEYYGDKLNHATVIKRICDLIHPSRVYAYGIRSGEEEEFAFAKKENILVKEEEELLGYLENKSIYLSLDLDVLDPSVAPGVTTPEPGGLDFNTLLDIIYKISKRASSIVSADIVELTPTYDPSGITSIVAAKLLRELALCMLS
jgi:agmatinase